MGPQFFHTYVSAHNGKLDVPERNLLRTFLDARLATPATASWDLVLTSDGSLRTHSLR